MTVFRVAPVLVLVAACTEDVLPAPDGPHHHYVVSELRIPSNNTEARASSLDLNHDDTVDNQLGMIFGVLDGQGLGVGSTATAALLRGGLVMLADLQTPSFDNAATAGFTMFLGADPSPTPCLDPDDLATCGQHLDGSGTFTVQPGSSSTTIVGPIEDNRFLAGDATLSVQLVIDDQSPAIRLDLRHARVELRQITEDRATAILAGGVTTADIAAVIIPQAQAQIDRIIRTECGVVDAPGPCGCPEPGRADTLQRLFDGAPIDCRVTADEIADNTLVQSLLAPDLRLDGEDFLSFGVGVELAHATFDADRSW